MAKGIAWRSTKHARDVLKQKLKNHEQLICFDTESTGLADIEKGIQEVDIKIIQFSAILYDIKKDENDSVIALQQRETFNMYLNPEELLAEEVISVTGITDDMLIGAETEETAAWKIYKFMSKADLWIGYNVNYDIKRLEGMSERTGETYNEATDIIDVLPMARDIITLDDIREFTIATGRKKLYRLENITPYLFPDMDTRFHDSLEDVHSTAKCFEELYKRYFLLDFDKEKTGHDHLCISNIKFTLNYHSPLKSKKIVTYTTEGVTGIQWDMYYGYWTCDSKYGSDKTFKNVDIYDLEKQVLKIANTRFHISATTMDDLANEMFRNFSKSPEGKRLNKLSRNEQKKRDEKKKGEETLQQTFDEVSNEEMDICIE